jgi:hypothetical protein
MFCTPLLEGWKVVVVVVVVGGHGSFGNLRFSFSCHGALKKGKGEKVFPLLTEHSYDI